MGERVKFSDAVSYALGGEFIAVENRFKLKKTANGQLIHICEEPYMYFRHYVEDSQISRVYFNCCKPDNDMCPLCTDGNNRTPRFAMNVIEYVYEDGVEKPKAKLKVWDISSKIMKNLQDIEKEFGNLLNFDLKLICDNEQFQSISLIVPKANEKIRDKIEKLKADKKLFNLEIYSKCMTPADMKKTLGVDSATTEDDAIDIDSEDEKPKMKKEDKKEVKKDKKEEKKKKPDEDEDDDIEIEEKEEKKKKIDDDDAKISNKKEEKKESKKKDDDDDDEDLDSFFNDDDEDK